MTILKAISPTSRALLRKTKVRPLRVPPARQDIFESLLFIQNGNAAASYAMTDGQRYRHLVARLGLVATQQTQTARRVEWWLQSIAGHCAGWVRFYLPESDPLELINFERERQKQLFLDGDIFFDVSKPGLDEDLKLQVLAEEIGEVANALDLLRRSNKTLLLSRKAVNHLCAELIQTAAVAVAWLESFEADNRQPSADSVKKGAKP